MCQEMGGASRE